MLGANGFLLFIDALLTMIYTRVPYAKVKDSHSATLGISSIAVSSVGLAGPVLALCSIFLIGFQYSLASWLEMGGIFLMLILQGVKMFKDIKLYKA